MVAAICDVQILTTFDTQAFASRIMQGLDRHFEQGIFTQDGGEVNLCAFRQDHTHFIDQLIVEGIQLGDLPGQVMRKILQAAYTFNRRVAFKAALNDESLLRAPNVYRARHIAELEVVNDDLTDVKRKFVAVADFLMHDKTDIDAEWFAGIRHSESFSGVRQLADDNSGASSLTPKFILFYRQ